MKMSVDQKNKLTFLWLTEEERADNILKEDALGETGNREVVFISGKHDLFPLMEGLVKHNAGMAE